jgi:hypothetical protein
VALSFNTAGSCVPGEHYMLSPALRLERVLHLIDEKKYFTLHAGHQTGKTTCARWLTQHYNQSDRYRCLWVDVQTAREQADPAIAFRSLLNSFDQALTWRHPDLKRPDRNEIEAMLQDPTTALLEYLTHLAQLDPRPLVVLIDEADGLIGAAMVSLLTQLRAGYLARGERPFPQSIALIGRKQVRDYALTMEERRAVTWLGTSSPFNISAEATTLRPFTAAEVAELLGQHTEATGQRFLPEAAALIFELSQGHPWLTNALADHIVSRDVKDRGTAITAADVEAAKEALILERRSHIDSLIHRLHEDRVARILGPMLAGGHIAPYDALNDDFAYVLGLGLIADRGGQYKIANPIYQEVIPRALAYDQQVQLCQEVRWYTLPDGGLDMKKLMLAWQEYWREDGHLAAEGFKYREAGPHLMMMAFLQRIVNGGGRIAREYGLGRKALDLLLTWPRPGAPPERHAIEIKLRRDRTTEQKGIAQLGGYLEQAGLSEGWLVLFDLRKRRPWRQRPSMKGRKAGNRRIWVVHC